MKIYIGHDSIEQQAYDVACYSLQSVSRLQHEPIKSGTLRAHGLWDRQVDKRGSQPHDFTSDAPCSTDFSVSRFMVPILCQSGWALFVDCDVLFLSDPIELMSLADPSKAVMCVQHNHFGVGTKMVGLAQTAYSRKNWSSVMLFNCDHPANKRITVHDVNRRPGRDLHGFYWLNDSEIGAIPSEWNWLVNVTEKPAHAKIAHFTNGGPWLKGWKPAKHDDLWEYYSNRSQNEKATIHG